MLERRGIPRIQPNKPRSPSAAVAAPKSDASLRYESGRDCIHNHEIKIEISLHSRSRTPAHTGFPTNPKRIRSAWHLNHNGTSDKERRRGTMMAKMAEKLAHVKGPVEYFPIKAPP